MHLGSRWSVTYLFLKAVTYQSPSSFATDDFSPFYFYFDFVFCKTTQNYNLSIEQ